MPHPPQQHIECIEISSDEEEVDEHTDIKDERDSMEESPRHALNQTSILRYGTPNSKLRASAPLKTSTPDSMIQDLTNNATTTGPRKPTSKELEKLCWNFQCHANLQLPDGQLCYYVMHVHPELAVPVCSFCLEQVNSFMAEQRDEEEDRCHGCGNDQTCAGEPLTLLCCDHCPRQFCQLCVAQSHGGGPTMGQQRVEELVSLQDEWKCLYCQPPSPLQDLQNQLQSQKNVTAKIRTAEDVLQELDSAEHELQNCQESLEDDALSKKRKEIHDELSLQNTVQNVQQELHRYQNVLLAHEHRISDFIATLQDELEVDFDMDLGKCYKKALQHPSQKTQEEQPEWKRRADKELDERPRVCAPDPSDPSVYEMETYEGVEDLMTTSQENSNYETNNETSCWRHSATPVSRQKLEQVMKQEDELLSQQNIKIETCIPEDEDVDEMLQEVQAKAAKNGSVRIQWQKPKAKRPACIVSRKQYTQPPAKVAAKRRLEGVNELSSRKKPRRLTSQQQTRDGSIVEATTTDESFWDTASSEEEEATTTPPRKTRKSSTISPQDSFKSGLILSTNKTRTITVAKQLVDVLKPHQKSGIHFMWRNSFADLNIRTHCDQVLEDKDIGGCILAHNMGLGKSLTTVAMIHTLLHHPSLECNKTNKRFIHTILLLVPVNTVANWKKEFSTWTRRVNTRIRPLSLDGCSSSVRLELIEEWTRDGGVLLLSKDTFRSLATKPDYEKALQNPGPDAVIIDEGHLMFASKDSQSHKTLGGIRTHRRVILTGSPFQNNLLEFYRMIEWMRKDFFGMSQTTFARKFANPIAEAMSSDATLDVVRESDKKSSELKLLMKRYIDRKGFDVLQRDLPPLQQAILHVRQTKMQIACYKELKKYQRKNGITNYLVKHTLAQPIHNHPSTLVMSSDDNQPEAEEGVEKHKGWCKSFIQKKGEEQMKKVENGHKVTLFLHILMKSIELGDRVVAFANSLPLLDYLEEILQKESWKDCAFSLEESFPDMEMGGWKRGVEYFRIDGQVNAADRGKLIEKFNRNVGKQTHLFLISMKAGGIGVNLHTANRVMLLDDHYNPTVPAQAIHRCYRYGQTKPVFAYRFQTEGTSEEKIYARSVNKIGVALNILDGKNIHRHFTNQQLTNLTHNDTWVQCDKCDKWRMLRPTEEEEPELPEKWYCTMNTTDPAHSSCTVPERDEAFYEKHFQTAFGATNQSDPDVEVISPAKVSNAEERKQEMTMKDVVLLHLLEICPKKKSSKSNDSYISKHDFHEALLETSRNPFWDDEAPKVKVDSIENTEEDAAATSSAQEVADTASLAIQREGGMEGGTDKSPKVSSPNQRNADSDFPKATKVDFPMAAKVEETEASVLPSGSRRGLPSRRGRPQARIKAPPRSAPTFAKTKTEERPSGHQMSDPIVLDDSDDDD